MTTEVTKPVLRMSYHDVIKWRGVVYDILTNQFIGEVLTPGMLRFVADTIADRIKTKKKIKGLVGEKAPEQTTTSVHEAVLQSIRAICEPDAVLDIPLAQKLTVRLAGNLHTLRSGVPVWPWEGQAFEEWVNADIVSAEKYVTPKRKLRGANITFKVLNGTAAGETLTQFFTGGQIHKMAHHLGLVGKYEQTYFHFRELVRMKLVLRLRQGEELEFDEYYERDSLNKRNKKLHAGRDVVTRKCPANMTCKCHICHIGYDRCQFGTHPTTFVKGDCRNGHLGWMVPGERYCIKCKE